MDNPETEIDHSAPAKCPRCNMVDSDAMFYGHEGDQVLNGECFSCGAPIQYPRDAVYPPDEPEFGGIG